MAGTVYRNTFGNEGRVVFSTQRNHHFQIMRALTERGYARVDGDTLKDQEGWLDGNEGWLVHVNLEGGGKGVFFMTQDADTSDRVTEALKKSFPGIELHPKEKVSSPE